MIERKWKPDNHKLEDAFFPVELCDLKFVYPAETDLLYFVVSDKGDGSMVYSNNYEDFISAVDAFDRYLNEQNND